MPVTSAPEGRKSGHTSNEPADVPRQMSRPRCPMGQAGVTRPESVT